jgi:quercetin dioxygenase-like cupin family protein
MHVNTPRSRAVVSSALWALAVLGAPAATANGGGAPQSAATVATLMTHDLQGAPGKEVLMLTVGYGGGGQSLPHRHHAQVFVYVLEGHVRMQVQGGTAVVLGAGGTFYEGPDDVHVVSANASRTEPARILVVMIKDKGSPASMPAPGDSP